MRQVRPIRLDQIKNLRVQDIPRTEDLVPELVRYAWLGLLALALVAWAMVIYVRPDTPRDVSTTTGIIVQIQPIEGHRITHQRITLEDARRAEHTFYVVLGAGQPQFLDGATLKIGDRIEATATSFAYVTEIVRNGRTILRDEEARASAKWRTFIPGLLATILTLAAIVLGVLTHYWRDFQHHFKPITV
jgi:hypothetical protein